MSKQDIMHVKEKYNRHGELSFELYCSGKDPVTRKNKVYVKTYKVPAELKGKKEIAAFRLQCQVEWKEEVANLSTGRTVRKEKILFADYANDFTESILARDPEAYNYYSKCKDQVEIINTKLGDYYLHELTQDIIDKFVLWLCQRTYTKETITVIKSLRPLIEEQKLKLIEVAKDCKFSDCTLGVALKIGGHVQRSTMEKLCKKLSVNPSDYFDIHQEQTKYALSANQSTRAILHAILKKAAKQGHIPRNFISREYCDPIKGRPKAKRAIYDTRESILEFDKCITNEQKPEVKIACALYLHLGLRGCEAAGLEWKDFTFTTPTESEVYIQRNTIYVSGFGVVTKDTKTENSQRPITLTERLYYLLLEYRKWWDEQKVKHGDMWANTDRLFVTDNGKDRSGQTLAVWVREFEARNGLKHVPPHSLRSTNITLQGLVNVPKKAVQMRAGHAHYSTTADIYDKGTKTANQEAAHLLNDFFNDDEN